MTIVYEIEKNLYMNLTNRCTCRCTFCVRDKSDGVHGIENLWLEKDVTTEEAIKALKEYNLENYESVVFCGYGEPLLRLEQVIEVAKYIRSVIPIKIRINTNGLANLTYKKDIVPMLAPYIDSVSISLNAADSKRYEEVCQPVYKEKAYEGLLAFAKSAKEQLAEVAFSVVEGTIPEVEMNQCKKIAEEMGIPLRVRTAV